MCFPFGDEHEVDSLASDMGKLFQMNPSALEDETLALQTDIQVKARARGQFWNLLDEEKDPNIRKWATSLTALFGSTYLCEPNDKNN